MAVLNAANWSNAAGQAIRRVGEMAAELA